jgi:hypothetical protein
LPQEEPSFPLVDTPDDQVTRSQMHHVIAFKKSHSLTKTVSRKRRNKSFSRPDSRLALVHGARKKRPRRSVLLRSAKKTRSERQIRQPGSREFVQNILPLWNASRSATGARLHWEIVRVRRRRPE